MRKKKTKAKRGKRGTFKIKKKKMLPKAITARHFVRVNIAYEMVKTVGQRQLPQTAVRLKFKPKFGPINRYWYRRKTHSIPVNSLINFIEISYLFYFRRPNGGPTHFQRRCLYTGQS